MVNENTWSFGVFYQDCINESANNIMHNIFKNNHTTTDFRFVTGFSKKDGWSTTGKLWEGYMSVVISSKTLHQSWTVINNFRDHYVAEVQDPNTYSLKNWKIKASN